MGRRIQVAVRLRPGEGGAPCVGIEDKNKKDIIVSDPSGTHTTSIPRSFHVDQIIQEDCTNEELFRRLVFHRIRSSVDEPDTSCFLAYGHTNSGKTHSIVGTATEPGLLSLSAKTILETYGVAEVAMIEVYGENVHDLLGQGERRLIRRRSSPAGTAIVVEGLTTCSLTSMEEWEAVSEYGLQTRRTKPTERNARSSRSHAIFTIKSEGLRLCLVDLAGSERQTIYSPQLNKESIAINKSLSRLSTVLEALSKVRLKANGTTSYVNFRDTTLTVLLQRYLSGASMTFFLACIHPDAQFCEETVSTLRYTQRLKCINTRAAPQKPSEDMSLFYRGEKQNLLAELMMLRKIVGGQQNENYHLGTVFGHGVDLSISKRLEKNSTLACLPQVRDCSIPNTVSKDCQVGGEECRQRLLRSKDTMRVAGWLLSRILSELPELFVGFDDYFDSYLPSQVQVVGYVSLMTCLAPRDVSEAKDSLAFLDVGDIAMGLTMLDAGIPACVRLHRLSCSESNSWEAHEYDEMNRVFVLAFFEINDSLVEKTGGTPDAFECCEGFLTLEPLVPLAMVLCTPLSASDELKENILHHLVTLHSEQEDVLEETRDNKSQTSLTVGGKATNEGSTGQLNISTLEEVMKWRLNCSKEVSSSGDSIISPTAPPVDEIEHYVMNHSKLSLSHQEPPSVNPEVQATSLPNVFPYQPHAHSFMIASTSSSVMSPSPPLASRFSVSVDWETSSSHLVPSKREQSEVVPEGGFLQLNPPQSPDKGGESEKCGQEDVDARSHDADKDIVSVSPANVHLDVSDNTTPISLRQSGVYPVQEKVQDDVDSPKAQSDNKTHDPSVSSALAHGRLEHAGNTKRKKKKKKFFDRRKPVSVACHTCTVL